jgi:RNA polymerase sigma-70 factor, ECF subfamily
MVSALREGAAGASVDLDRWMERYRQSDMEAAVALIRALSPSLLRYFNTQTRSYDKADDLLQETWLRIHRVRNTYLPGKPAWPWIYSIVRRVRIDGYRRTRVIARHEVLMDKLPEGPSEKEQPDAPLAFEALVSALSDSEREVITMLKLEGLSLEEVARATSSTVGAVKQKAHRAYGRLRQLLQEAQI